MELNNWLIKDTSEANATYYGYADPDVNTGDIRWMILKEVVDGDITTRYFANNDFTFDKIWDDRTAYFVEPTTPPALEHSGITYYSDGVSLSARWEYQSGMTRYYVSVYDKNEKKALKNWDSQKVQLTPQKKIPLNVKLASNKTYVVILTGKNGIGKISTSFTVST